MTLRFIVFAIALTTGGLARAEVHKHAKGRVSVDIPSSWKVTKDKSGVLVGESKDDAVGLLFWVIDKTDAKAAIRQLDRVLEGKVSNVKWGQPQDAQINGMTGIKNAGTAIIEGKQAFVMFAIVGPTPTGKGVIVFGAIEQSKLTEHKAELTNIFDSLAPAS